MSAKSFTTWKNNSFADCFGKLKFSFGVAVNEVSFAHELASKHLQSPLRLSSFHCLLERPIKR